MEAFDLTAAGGLPLGQLGRMVFLEPAEARAGPPRLGCHRHTRKQMSSWPFRSSTLTAHLASGTGLGFISVGGLLGALSTPKELIKPHSGLERVMGDRPCPRGLY